MRPITQPGRTAKRGLIVGSLVVLISLALLLAACGQNAATVSPSATTPPIPTSTPTPAGPTIAMVDYQPGFLATKLAIKAGQAVTFSIGGQFAINHILVTGKNGQYIAEPGAPPEFNSPGGTDFEPGDSKSIIFANAGTFDITCTLHPFMQLTITVSP